ncbi:MAG: hypothetical protein HUU47_10110 [Bacteroidetes bacterium]|nr:hypothetical protein [Bacteroidota bacterium]
MKNFYIILFVITAFLGASFLILEKLQVTQIGNAGWYSLIFYVFLTIILTNYAIKSGNRSNSLFVSSIMAITGLRMFLCIIFIVINRYFTGKTDLNFIIYFFILYLFYTLFEIQFLLYKLRTDKKDDNQN